ncbi:MAG: F0F1 ATP synthase subunit delta [Pseudomonadota bacterium]|nr:F0F1 ATP synthase subunit delta [Pseudomonadota bacterium]
MSAASASAQGRISGPVAGIAERYADALFDLARESESIEAVEADLKALKAAIAGSPELRAFLASPLYGAEDQQRAVAAVAGKAGFTPLVSNFLALVAKNRRLFALDPMIRAFIERLAKHRGEVSAEALSAAPLSEDHLKRLRSEIEAMVGKAVNLTVGVDPELLGGLVVKVGSTMIDSSLKTKLNRLKSVMKEA